MRRLKQRNVSHSILHASHKQYHKPRHDDAFYVFRRYKNSVIN